MLARVQASLLSDFQELRQKRFILNYYVSLDFPTKQKKIINWWSMMIEEAIRRSNEAYLSPSQLETIFTLHCLKPLPLPSILSLLSFSENFEWRGKRQDQKSKQKESFTKKILNKVWSVKDKNEDLSLYRSFQNDTGSKFICRKVNMHLNKLMMDQVCTEVGLQKSICLEYLIGRLREQLPLSAKAIDFLINQSTNKYWIIDEIQGKKAFIYSENFTELSNKNWVKVEKSKFLLRTTIDDFEKKLQRKFNEEKQKLKLAKSTVQNDKSKAKKILSDVQGLRKTTQHIENHIKALKNSLYNLQISETNLMAIDLLGQTQKIYQEVKADVCKLDAIKEKNDEIRMHQKQVNMVLEDVKELENEEIEDEVNNLMRELQKEVSIKRVQKKIEVIKAPEMVMQTN